MSIGSAEPIAVEPDPGESNGSATVDRALPADQRPLTVVNAKVRIGQRLKDIWASRELLVLLVRTDLKIKYKSSVLGYLWSMLNPALVLAIYFVIFNIISKNGIPQFAIWLFSGLLVWNLFNNAAMTATGVVVGRAGIVKKVAFPRSCWPCRRWAWPSSCSSFRWVSSSWRWFFSVTSPTTSSSSFCPSP